MISPSPFALRNLTGSREDFFIHDGYSVRTDAQPYDDTPNSDEFQKEIYEYARQRADDLNLLSVCDIGCGSGFKLITNFFDRPTLGVEVPATVQFLERRWPGREWRSADIATEEFTNFDLLLAVDVIEHLESPNVLMGCIQRSEPRHIILSTPERDELCLGTHDGPPRNNHHVREWNFAEFHAYVADWFEIKDHFVIHGTQCVECVTS